MLCVVLCPWFFVVVIWFFIVVLFGFAVVSWFLDDDEVVVLGSPYDRKR